MLSLEQLSRGGPVALGGLGGEAVQRIVGIVEELPAGALRVAGPGPFQGTAQPLFHSGIRPLEEAAPTLADDLNRLRRAATAALASVGQGSAPSPG